MVTTRCLTDNDSVTNPKPDPALQAISDAIAAREAAERVERQAVADALNAGHSWRQIGAHLGQEAGNLHRKYTKYLDVEKSNRTYQVKDND